MPERRRSASALHPALGRADQGDHVHRKRSRNAFQCPQGRDLRAPIASPRFLACRFSYGSEIKLVTKVTPDEAPPRGIIANVWSHRLLTMRFIRPKRLLPFFSLLFLSWPIQGAQTSPVCIPDPSLSLIFVGTLTELTPDDNHSWNHAKFQVTELLQGEPLDVVSALMMKNLCGGAATEPRIGGSYLVLTQHFGKGIIGQLLRCEQVRPASEATPELDYLRSSQLGETSAELSGEVTVDALEKQILRKVPLAGAKIQLSAEGRTVKFVSDEGGLFRGTLKPGKYAVRVQLPSGYSRPDYGLGSIITLTEHRCTELKVSASPTGSIMAHIVDMGGAKLGPMSRIQLTLETAEDQQFVRSVWPDENSDLVMKDLPPGEYLLGLNTYLPGPLYPPTYFPGVNKRSDAQVISLALGEHKVLPEMRIMKGQECEIPVLVSEASGKPSAGTPVALAYPDYPHFYSDSGNDQTDEEGRTKVYAVFPGPVLLRAERKRDDNSLIQSEPAEIKTCPAQPILLKLSTIVTLPDPPEKP
jgi:hypothetical protein